MPNEQGDPMVSSEVGTDEHDTHHEAGLERRVTASSHVSISPGRQTAVMILITITQLCQM